MERRKRRSPVEEYIESLLDSPEKLERCAQFYQNLRGFYHRKWKCPLKAPCIQGVEVDLFHLYEIVNSLGGWQKVSTGEKWSIVAHAVGITEGVAVAEHAIKVLYMRYLSKFEQNETVGDVDDNESELLGSRSRSKGFSSLANADCPISSSSRYTIDLYRGKAEKRGEPDYDRLLKSLYCGLPNEVDFAINICTLLSHPGPRFLRLAFAPQILTLLVAHVGVFSSDDDSLYDLYKAWQQASGHDFISFWKGAGIEDEEILALLPHVQPSKVSAVDMDLFGGLVHEFRLKDVVSWRVHQILSIVRNLSFEIINKPVMAASWPLMRFLFVCCGCKWSSLRTAALDALSNIASEIDLLCEESSATNHLLLKTVSRCLHSGDKLQIIRALEILAGLCNNERNESLLCEFLDARILGKIFEILIVKDMMMCVYTLEALYQISELGAVACQQVSLLPHSIEILVDLATVEAYSFGPSGLSGIKVVEFHGPPQLAALPQQPMPAFHARFGARQTMFPAPHPQLAYHTPPRAGSTVHSPIVRVATVSALPLHPTAQSVPVIGESKVEQLTSKWLRLNCIFSPGNIIPRGELYAAYVEDLRNHYNALSGSVQMFTNIIKALFPSVLVRVGTNTTSMVIENLKYVKNQVVPTLDNTPTMANTSVPGKQSIQNTMAASHPVMQKILLGNGSLSSPLVNGHYSVPDRGIVRNESNVVINSVRKVMPVVDPQHAATHVVPVTSLHNKVNLEVCTAAVEARDFMSDDGRHEAKIVRVENASSTPVVRAPQICLQVGVETSCRSSTGPVVKPGALPESVVPSTIAVDGLTLGPTQNSLNPTPNAQMILANPSTVAASGAIHPGVNTNNLSATAIHQGQLTIGAKRNNDAATDGHTVINDRELVNANSLPHYTVNPNGTAGTVAFISTTADGRVLPIKNSAFINSTPMPSIASEGVINGNVSQISPSDLAARGQTAGAKPLVAVPLNNSTTAVGTLTSHTISIAETRSGSDEKKMGMKRAVSHRMNGLKDEKVEILNGDVPHNVIGQVSLHEKVSTNGVVSVKRAELPLERSLLGSQVPTVVIKDSICPGTSTSVACNVENTDERLYGRTSSEMAVPVKRRRTSRCNTPRVNDHGFAEKVLPSTSADCASDYMCEWNGCGRVFSTASFVLYHCAKEHVADQLTLQCHWPRCDSTVRTKLSMITHLQDHHCNDNALLLAAKRRKEGYGTILGPVHPERPRDMHQHPGYAKNAAIEAIRRHAFTYLPREITDDSEGPVTKSIRLTSSLILRNLARYSTDGRRLIRRHETLLSWLASSRLESSSALAQLLGELYNSQPASSQSHAQSQLSSLSSSSSL